MKQYKNTNQSAHILHNRTHKIQNRKNATIINIQWSELLELISSLPSFVLRPILSHLQMALNKNVNSSISNFKCTFSLQILLIIVFNLMVQTKPIVYSLVGKEQKKKPDRFM